MVSRDADDVQPHSRFTPFPLGSLHHFLPLLLLLAAAAMVLFHYPSPEEVLRIGPVRNVARAGGALQASMQELLEKGVVQELTRQIMSGRCDTFVVSWLSIY